MVVMLKLSKLALVDVQLNRTRNQQSIFTSYHTLLEKKVMSISPDGLDNDNGRRKPVISKSGILTENIAEYLDSICNKNAGKRRTCPPL